MRLAFVFLFFVTHTCAQTISKKLQAAVDKMEVDSQFRHGTLSLYVVETKTGKVIFDRNAQVGLAPASCQKVITATTAFELLGKDYKYTTGLGYDGKIGVTASAAAHGLEVQVEINLPQPVPRLCR